VRADIVALFWERRKNSQDLYTAPLQRSEAAELAELLARHSGNVSAVAHHTGRSRASVYRWLRRLGLSVPPRPVSRPR
jgi:transcriptional regulator of acetoin/glycerol metabolism